MTGKQVIKPMLATEVDFNKLRYPVYTQPKLDGVRVIIKDGVVYSRSLKAIPEVPEVPFAPELPEV